MRTVREENADNPHPSHIGTADQGSPRPHLRRDLGSPVPHLHWDLGPPRHICATAPGLIGLTPTHICAGTDWAHPAHICDGMFDRS